MYNFVNGEKIAEYYEKMYNAVSSHDLNEFKRIREEFLSYMGEYELPEKLRTQLELRANRNLLIVLLNDLNIDSENIRKFDEHLCDILDPKKSLEMTLEELNSGLKLSFEAYRDVIEQIRKMRDNGDNGNTYRPKL